MFGFLRFMQLVWFPFQEAEADLNETEEYKDACCQLEEANKVLAVAAQ